MTVSTPLAPSVPRTLFALPCKAQVGLSAEIDLGRNR